MFLDVYFLVGNAETRRIWPVAGMLYNAASL
jgi:hypothetical protein